MSKHTPEPWLIGDRDELSTNFYSDDATGSIIGGCPAYPLALRSLADRQSNARRIVNCVNACAGMTDPAAEIAELKRQRDELLWLVKAVSYHSIPATVDGIKCAAFPWAEYESMVAKAKGSAS